jgi:hypothetical protein
MAAMILLAWNADGATAEQKAPAKKTAAKKKAAPARKSAGTGKKTPVKTASSHGKKPAAKRGVTWRNRQTSPSPDRYREIQGALAAKGFLKPEDATGAWNQTSSDALKKFQTEQNLESSGRINSLSLIALGLGPHRDTVPKPPEPPPGQ